MRSVAENEVRFVVFRDARNDCALVARQRNWVWVMESMKNKIEGKTSRQIDKVTKKWA